MIFTRKIYPEVDPAPEQELMKRLRRAVFTDAREVDPRTVVLVSLAHAADLLKIVFDKKELRGRKARIEKVVNGEVTGKAAKAAIEAMQAAMMVAVVMPALMASTTSCR